MDGLKEKFSRGFVLSILAVGIVLLLMGYTYFNNSTEYDVLTEQHSEVSGELTSIERTIAERQAEIEGSRSDAVYEATGLRPELVETDSSAAQSFFRNAFDWSSGAEYDSARSGYIDALGEDNSFTEVYMPPDIVIETDDGDLSYIDHEGLQSELSSMHIVPLTAEGETRIRYVAFVTYYMHGGETSFQNTDALDASQAIIQFTASGDPDDGERNVSEVLAWPGFSSTDG